MGGIDVQNNLTQKHAIDPESFAAIFAEKVAPEFADAFVVTANGRVLYNGEEVRLYSMAELERGFKVRERLVEKSQR